MLLVPPLSVWSTTLHYLESWVYNTNIISSHVRVWQKHGVWIEKELDCNRFSSNARKMLLSWYIHILSRRHRHVIRVLKLKNPGNPMMNGKIDIVISQLGKESWLCRASQEYSAYCNVSNAANNLIRIMSRKTEICTCLIDTNNRCLSSSIPGVWNAFGKLSFEEHPLWERWRNDGKKRPTVSWKWILFSANYTSLNLLGHGTGYNRFVISTTRHFDRFWYDELCFPGW